MANERPLDPEKAFGESRRPDGQGYLNSLSSLAREAVAQARQVTKKALISIAILRSVSLLLILRFFSSVLLRSAEPWARFIHRVVGRGVQNCTGVLGDMVLTTNVITACSPALGPTDVEVPGSCINATTWSSIWGHVFRNPRDKDGAVDSCLARRLKALNDAVFSEKCEKALRWYFEIAYYLLLHTQTKHNFPFSYCGLHATAVLATLAIRVSTSEANFGGFIRQMVAVNASIDIHDVKSLTTFMRNVRCSDVARARLYESAEMDSRGDNVRIDVISLVKKTFEPNATSLTRTLVQQPIWGPGAYQWRDLKGGGCLCHRNATSVSYPGNDVMNMDLTCPDVNVTDLDFAKSACVFYGGMTPSQAAEVTAEQIAVAIRHKEEALLKLGTVLSATHFDVLKSMVMESESVKHGLLNSLVMSNAKKTMESVCKEAEHVRSKATGEMTNVRKKS
ncbi:hypothetical protein M427DRAFT_58915 [Gonapodya prolifera JEL478]|uniref:Uncharacterized protein n=1 Tax=Gonapodya prolifera (strain JEL478) TaxID=1344416 RepID=A0A139A961_GONPJ|nr:hypothetical protein M427DRAFT_58915 [Gonapodya prolifera JEL478]|eukprot:KXS13198.1 hypothetical protein M427DRAFT_58915 [Gonapodya prolifera JEL478]